MKKSMLSTSGLSMSQAQSASNIINQLCEEIDRKLNSFNSHSRVVVLNGVEIEELKANPVTISVVSLLKRKGNLRAAQAFLMEAIKTKNELLDEVRRSRFKPEPFDQPEPNYMEFYPEDLIDESWGWDQLTYSEYCEYLDVEANAAHIGQFIHNKGVLSKLREDIANLKSLVWIELESGKKTPVKITPSTSSDDLMTIHLALAELHRQYESRVNYYKAKVKNMVSDRNAEISKNNTINENKAYSHNVPLKEAYEALKTEHRNRQNNAMYKFEEEKEMLMKKVASLRIVVNDRFKPVIDEILKSVNGDNDNSKS
jgi:hypothetical protein